MTESLHDWVFVAKLDDVPKGKKRCFTIGDASVVVCRVYAETFVLKNLCPHLNQPLGEGRLVEYELTCPYHNASFDIRNGNVVSGPSVWPVETYQCKVDDGNIFFKSKIKTGDGKIKDPRLQP